MEEGSNSPVQEQPREPNVETAPEQPQEQLVQLMVKVPLSVKEKAQMQADLAFKYGWIKSATLTQLYIWTTESLLDSAIRGYIQTRRKGVAEKPS